PLDAQVVTPDLLHQLSVVTALHPDPRPARHPRPGTGHRHRPGRSPLPSRLSWGGAVRYQPDRLPINPEPGTERERTGPPLTVLEHHQVHPAALLHPDDRTDPAGLHLLDHQTGLRRLVPSLRSPPGMWVVGQDVTAIAIEGHRARLGGPSAEPAQARPAPWWSHEGVVVVAIRGRSRPQPHPRDAVGRRELGAHA